MHLVIRIAQLFLFILLLTTFSCGSSKPASLIPEGASITLQSITVQAGSYANNGEPVTLDIVYVYDEKALNKLQGYTAAGWFSIQGTDLLDWGDQVETQTLIMNPGEEKQITQFPERDDRVLALTFFANYKTPGLHRYFVVGGSNFVVDLGQYGYTVGGE